MSESAAMLIAGSIFGTGLIVAWTIAAASDDIRKKIAIVADRLLDIQRILETRR